MAQDTPIRIAAHEGVEIWRLVSGGVERFAVRLGARRARLVSSLASAESVVARHLHHARLARAH